MNAVLAETSCVMGPGWSVRPSLYDAPLRTANNDVTVYELWQRFDQSEYGLHMDSQPLRFAERFGYGRDDMVTDLGADVIPRLHQYETGLYVAHLLAEERRAGSLFGCDDDEAALITFTASIHDMGETTHPAIEAEVGKTVGDIPSGMKTDEDRRVEAAVRASLYRRLYADLPAQTIDRVEAIIAHKDETLLHDIFETAHALQSYVTAVRAHIAFEKAVRGLLDFANPDTPRKDAAAIDNLKRLTTAVMLTLNPKIEEYTQVSVFARKVQGLGNAAIEKSGFQTDISYSMYRESSRR